MASRLPGAKIFRRLNARLQKKRKGYIVAIDPKTGKYVMGRDELAVALKAREMYPATLFSVFRIGHRAVHKFRGVK